MVRTVVSEMMKICKNPTKHNTTEMAKTMVARYPKSPQDVIDGEFIGLGCHSLAKQLSQELLNDLTHQSLRNAKQHQLMTLMKYLLNNEQLFKTHGCVNLMPKHLPLSVTVESARKKKKK